MPVVSTYTNKTLAQYMERLATRQVTDLAWTSGDPTDDTDLGSFQDQVDTLALEMEATDIADIPEENVYELRLRARVALWQSLAEAYVGLYRIGGLARTLDRQQLYEHCVQMWDRSLNALMKFLAVDALSVYGGVPHSEVRRIKPVWGTSDPFYPNKIVTPE